MSDMIKVRCRTNLDTHKGMDWPCEMVCRPRKGDSVLDSTRRHKLYIVGITHTVGNQNALDLDIVGKPYLIIELHNHYPGLGGE